MRYIFVLLLLSSVSFGQKRYFFRDVVCPNDTITYLKFNMKPINGVVYCAFGDMGEFIDGKPNDVHRDWYADNAGQYVSEINYKDGKKDGNARFWWPNGQLKSESVWKNGEINGFSREWYENGQLSNECSYKNGVRDGDYKDFYPNGQLLMEEVYKDGKTEGVVKVWFYDGQLMSLRPYKNGLMDGSFKVWYENGQLRFEQAYIQGRQDGIYREWHVNGQLHREMNYKIDKIIDDKVVFYKEDGTIKGTAYYEDGKEVGCEGYCH